MATILIAEDDHAISDLVAYNLERAGHTPLAAYDGLTALEVARRDKPELILLDQMMPGMDGHGVLRELRRDSRTQNIPVIFLTAKAQAEDRIQGLELGADDYLPKPFHLAELNARIKSVIRRNQHDGEITIRQGNVRIEPDKYRVFVDEQELELNRKEYDILLYFINRPGRLVNKSTLAESVWGDHIDQVDNFDFIYAQIKNLRKKLKDSGANIEIKAVYGFGYKMIVE